ncbi:hypothetical protein EAG_15012 [Camponotus floridanus]|uniref:Uncharacterized protein n=1 Tax=Camponotus floridanus TaxID=104421 RepID=E2AZQ7_CAMFO|nr:hypothetical protein EAG_15012 [Camponotus floridanus]
MATLRDQIIAYFETKDKIMPTVNQMYNTSTELSDISVQHTAVELELIKQQITIWLNREEYNITRNKIELAVNYYFANSLICSINDAAAMYGADPDIVKDEVIIACSQLWTKYHFDRPVETPSVSFSALQVRTSAERREKQYRLYRSSDGSKRNMMAKALFILLLSLDEHRRYDTAFRGAPPLVCTWSGSPGDKTEEEEEEALGVEKTALRSGL